MLGIIKLILAFVFIGLVAIGSFFGGFVGFVVTMIIVLIFSSMFSRIEKNKIEKKRHEETLQCIENNK